MRFETVVVTISAVGDGRVLSQMVLVGKFKNFSSDLNFFKYHSDGPIEVFATASSVANFRC